MSQLNIKEQIFWLSAKQTVTIQKLSYKNLERSISSSDVIAVCHVCHAIAVMY